MIILIHGYKRSGKDTFASILNELLPQSEIHAFAEPLKEITAKSFGLSLDLIDKLKNDETIKIGFRSPNEKMCTGSSMRNFLQNLGTEAMKPVFGDYVWAKLFTDRYLKSPVGVVFIAPDFRVIEEYQYITSEAVISNTDTLDVVTVKIQRADAECSGDPHVTEQGLKDFNFDWTIDNNGTLDDLRAEAVEFLDFIKDRL